ncbi:MAG: hypothetical protein C0594_11600 [Marinilabiliales bacterium]|nr:MAG: hypothetical protein C0594_11600 [Marinilabiliales bacterium]
MKLKFIFISIFAILSLNLLAQDESETVSQEKEDEENIVDYFEILQENKPNAGQVTIYQDAELYLLVNRHIKLNKKQPGFNGWRVEIFSENGYGARDAAHKARKKFIEKYPDIGAYVSYDGINFKVRVGDFRNKNEAKKSQYSIAEDYPYTFLVKDLIEFPKLNY